ncbi:MAG: PAS domain S-box protein [Nitrospirota bacterium]
MLNNIRKKALTSIDIIRYLERLSITQRAMGFVVISLALLLWTNFSNIPQLAQMAESARVLYDHPHTVTNAIKDAKILALLHRRIIREYILETNTEVRDQLLKNKQENEDRFNNYMKLAKERYLGDKTQVEEVINLYRQLLTYVQVEIDAAKQGKTQEALEHMRDSHPGNPWPLLLKTMDQIVDFAEGRAKETYKASQAIYEIERIHVFIYAVFSVITLILISYIFVRSLLRPLSVFRDNIVELSEGNFTGTIAFKSDKNEFGQLSRALDTLRQVAVREANDTFIKKQTADIARVLQRCVSFSDFGNELTSKIAPTMRLIYGAFYYVKQGMLIRTGGYACDESSNYSQFAFGQGLVGQAASNKTPLSIKLSSQGHIGTGCGLGTIAINAVYIVPVVHNDEVLAVLEMATTEEDFTDNQRAFIDALIPVIAMNTEILSGTIETQQLLQNSQAQTLALAASEQQLISRHDELEENNKRLAEQARLMEEQAEALAAQKEALIQQRTELQESRTALLHVEQRSQLILNSVEDGIIGLDTAGITTFINNSGAAMLGYSVEELTGCPAIHYVFPDGSEFLQEQCPMFMTGKDGQARTVTNEVLWRKNKTAFHVEYTATPTYKNGTIVGTVVVFRDITLRKHAH